MTNLPDDEQNLRNIVLAYTQAAQDLGRPPENVEDLRKHLDDAGGADKILVSPNDGEPYVVAMGLAINAQTNPGTIVAYEARGKDGVRKVVDLRMVVRAVATDEFKTLKFPPGHQPR